MEINTNALVFFIASESFAVCITWVLFSWKLGAFNRNYGNDMTDNEMESSARALSYTHPSTVWLVRTNPIRSVIYGYMCGDHLEVAGRTAAIIFTCYLIAGLWSIRFNIEKHSKHWPDLVKKCVCLVVGIYMHHIVQK